jgi:hypothetical protein
MHGIIEVPHTTSMQLFRVRGWKMYLEEIWNVEGWRAYMAKESILNNISQEQESYAP